MDRVSARAEVSAGQCDGVLPHIESAQGAPFQIISPPRLLRGLCGAHRQADTNRDHRKTPQRNSPLNVVPPADARYRGPSRDAGAHRSLRSPGGPS